MSKKGDYLSISEVQMLRFLLDGSLNPNLSSQFSTLRFYELLSFSATFFCFDSLFDLLVGLFHALLLQLPSLAYQVDARRGTEEPELN